MPPRKKSKAAKSSTLPTSVSGAGAAVPTELLMQIIQDAASPPPDYKGKVNYRTRALGAMCRVNKHWHSIAHESLYRCLCFKEKPEQMAKLRRTVVNSPAIAGLIIELDIHVIGEQQLPTKASVMTKVVARRQKAGKDLWDVLGALTGLRTLKIRRYLDLPKSYREELSPTVRLVNLATVQSFEMIRCDAAIATVLTRSMTSLEEFSSSAVASHQGDFRMFEGLTSHLTKLSFSGSQGCNNWDDWLDVVQHSTDTLHTLELESMDNIPEAVLKRALDLIAPSLLRLFYATRSSKTAAVLLAALPKMKNLISLRTSLRTTTVLALAPPTLVELGMAHQCHFYTEIQSDDVVLRDALAGSEHLPNLKILWLPGARRSYRGIEGEERLRQLETIKEQAVADGMSWTLLTGNKGKLPYYGSEEEIMLTEADRIARRFSPHIPDLRRIPGVYVARVKTGTAKVFDPAIFSRLQK
ncbi:hypothetical protein HWV62_39862 [Athelia sp. TMB]|nr:hypothetical protein HWV62_39862 [Athelia sp. TMB]